MLTGEKPQPATRPDAVQLRPRRSPKLIVGGVLCVVLGALAAAMLYSLNVTTASVVAMANDVERGESITADSLTVVELPRSTTIDTLSADRLEELVGATALTDLPAGAFPSERHLGERPLPAGHSLVGLRLETGRIPVTALVPGTEVRLVSLAEEQELVITAVLATSPRMEEHSSHYLLDVIVAQDTAPVIAGLAATNLLALIAEGDL